PLQRLAASAHSFFALRPRPGTAAYHADVLSRRSAARIRPDVHVRRGRKGAQAAHLGVRLAEHDSRIRARLPVRYRAPWPRRDSDGEQAMSLRASTSQTIGPFLRIGLEWMQIEELAPRGVSGVRVTIRGRVIDADGRPVNDAA